MFRNIYINVIYYNEIFTDLNMIKYYLKMTLLTICFKKIEEFTKFKRAIYLLLINKFH